MAKTASLSPSQNLTHILSTQLTQKNQHLNTITFFSKPCTRILSSMLINSKNINVRGLTSIFTAPLSIIPHNHNIIRKSCDSFRFPSLPLFPLHRSRSSSLCFSVMSQTNDLGATPPQDSAKTVRCVIKGRVQGVFYRNWTVENAAQLGLKGWVRNRRDGSVEALFSGKTETVEEMLQRCRRGPPDAMVTAFEAIPCNEDPGAGFERRSTV